MVIPDQREPVDQPSHAPSVKRPYQPPVLIEYGHIAKLTHTGFGSGADGGMMANRMMMCL
ncbi:MAG TPA: lasso RiPP family leader peptide-containing protein [Nitrospiraceae bacterium]|nr:lasso RiPP family leader peptide-containing protein [Nitrospiraceae bacterium]